MTPRRDYQEIPSSAILAILVDFNPLDQFTTEEQHYPRRARWLCENLTCREGLTTRYIRLAIRRMFSIVELVDELSEDSLDDLTLRICQLYFAELATPSFGKPQPHLQHASVDDLEAQF